MDRQTISDVERNFYKEYTLAICDYLQAYIWRFLLYALLVALGAWFAFYLMKKQEQEETPLFIFKKCQHCEDKEVKEDAEEAKDEDWRSDE